MKQGPMAIRLLMFCFCQIRLESAAGYNNFLNLFFTNLDSELLIQIYKSAALANKSLI